ncbi:LINE-1 reverse transcriptase-like protein [Elysia marginata]|uniref:LINE-1 reverse transcriptase-like protein n=1 Tax=Elysia marginata TaxID=1093978 RepID=A0AAV4I5C5_9GAST|nr:LINE-1 reverse transcriptase-like protein [Elysia marginata]
MRRWRWIGHTLRKLHNNIKRQALQWNPQGNRGRCRPRETWERMMFVEGNDNDGKRIGSAWKACPRPEWVEFPCAWPIGPTLPRMKGIDDDHI